MRTLSTQSRRELPTRQQQFDLFMRTLEDDTEDAPWMVMGDLQFWSASTFAHSLRLYAHQQGLPWYVASMLPVHFTWGRSKKRRQLAPDVMVAFVHEQPHTSFNVGSEGGFPPFVLEVISPHSIVRDQEKKRAAYELLGVQEYALFTPHSDSPSTLDGYLRGAGQVFERWLPDSQGRLWSAILGLYLVVRGTLLRVQTLEGRVLPTLEEAELDRAQEEEARRSAEQDVERLRRELERYRQEADGPS